MQLDAEMVDKLNLSVDEIAFYRALVTNEESVKTLGDDNLRQLAIELTQQLRKSATVDWQKRDSVRARMRNLVRRLLRRFKYPPDRSDEAIQLVLEQADALAGKWSQSDDPEHSEEEVAKYVINQLFQSGDVYSLEPGTRDNNNLYHSTKLTHELPAITANGHYGLKGGTYIKLPTLLKTFQSVMTPDGIIGEVLGVSLGSLLPLNCINMICKKLFGSKLALSSEECLVLTSFPDKTVRTVDELLQKTSRTAEYLGVKKIDEEELGEILSHLHKCELLEPLSLGEWEVKEKIVTVL